MGPSKKEIKDKYELLEENRKLRRIIIWLSLFVLLVFLIELYNSVHELTI